MGKQGYTGMSFPFRFDGRGGVAKSTTSHSDFSHIKEGIIQVLGTNLGERVMEINFGSEVYKAQFDNIYDEITCSELEYYVRDAIQIWDNRVEVKKVTITPIDTEEFSGLQVDIDLKAVKYLQDFSMSARISTEGDIELNG